ncbi:MAG: dTDP-glucose 4,6-dehydratase [Desulfobacterales bacterium]|nr:dTDP-glucose 4,6-dehydratase [Desulfobacterales bacterium]
MKNLLVTGGSGFIGANFIRYLLEKSDFSGRVINVDKLTYAGNPENLADIQEKYPDRYQFVHGDICDKNHMAEVFEKNDIDSVCHFAAESHVDRSIVEPDAFVQTNIMGTFNLLELARARQDRIIRFHHVSTDEVYGTLELNTEDKFTETTAYQPSSPYSASKAASDHLVRACHETYGLPITISNCSNNYGPYQFPEKLIPLILLNALDYKTLPVYGKGDNVRDWLYVEDHCSAIWLIMRKGRGGETYNVGGDCEMTNLTVVEMICDILDEIRENPAKKPRRELIEFVTDRPGHDLRYAIDFTKLGAELHWRPQANFQSGLRETILWYLEHGDWVERVQSGEYRKWIKQQYS